MYRHLFSVIAVTALLAFAGAMSLPTSAGTPPTDGHTTIDVANDGFSVVFSAHSAHELLSLTVRVAGPDGTVIFDQRVEGPMIEWVPSGELTDGALYQWEVRAVTATPGAERVPQPDYGQRLQQPNKAVLNTTGTAQGTGTSRIERRFGEADKHVARTSGLLQVENGLLTGPFSPNHTELGEQILGRVLGFLVTSAHAGQNFNDFVQVQDSGNDHHTYLALYSDDNSSWWVNNEGGDFRIEELDSIGVPIAHRMTVEPGGNLGLGTTQPQDVIHIRHPGPVIRFNDSNNEQTWQLLATEFGYRVADQTAATVPFFIAPGAPDESIKVAADGNIGLGTAIPSVPLHIVDEGPAINFDDSNDALLMRMLFTQGTYSLRNMTDAKTPMVFSMQAPDNSFHVDQFGRVGLGTNSQSEDLTISGGSFGVTIGMRTNSGAETWEIGGNTGQIFFRDQGTSAIPFAIKVGAPTNSLVVENSGNVGIGLGSASKQLDVQGTSPDALGQNETMLRVTNSSGTPAPRRMIELINNGSPLLVYKNTADGSIWNMSPVGNRFVISLTGTGAQELEVDGSGNLTIQGSLTELSSREFKDGFAPVDAETLLAKLGQLRIEEWHYRHTPGSRHVGPVAEDFHAVFGLGPDDGIAPRDLAGIALAAAKALKAENDAKGQRIEALEADLKRKDDRMAELESRLIRLETTIAVSVQ